MIRSRALLVVLVCLALGAFASTAAASPTFHPRIRNALGLIPAVNSKGQYVAQPSEGSVFTPVVYHGGQTMTGGVTVHAIFWAPAGFAFQGAPPGSKSYEALIEQYYTDVQAANTGTSGATCTAGSCNDFTVEPQYGFGTTPGGITSGANTIAFTNTSATFSGTQTLPSGADVILDSSPYPPGGCTSPFNARACVSDPQVQAEVDNIVQHTTGTPRGLHNLWYVFLPPDVDECIAANLCTNVFGGYHSLANLGNGVDIYAVTPDPLVPTGGVPQGTDPQGNPDAELVIDIANHETNEAMTDPKGLGWMDPNGFEVGDKCEFNPQRGTPLGFAANGSPFNQVINGHQYWTQEMWSQADGGCVQASTKTIADSPLPLPQVNLTQFGSTVTGNTETGAGGTTVTVSLIRTDVSGNRITTSSASTTSAGDGSWSVTLPGHAVGDDRDEVDVDYSGPNAPSPGHQVILTGNGGNPFTESGWTGWTDLDNGYALTNKPPSLTIGPCFQTGVESYTVNGTVGAESPSDFCSTSADTATVALSARVGPGDVVTLSTNDNRAFQPADVSPPSVPNASGGLVNLTIPVGEADSVSLFQNPLTAATGIPFTPTGFPTCSADLTAQSVTCTGLVPGANYTVNGNGGTADSTGTIVVSMRVSRGQSLALSNGSRTLTTLHVANLEVSINDSSPAKVASGTCSPDEWTNGPLSTAPTNTEAGGPGVALSGAACPSSGDAAGMSTSGVAQTDELSGGSTGVNLPDVLDTSPLLGETLYGSFTVLAESTGATLPIAVSIAPASGGAPVFTAANTDTANGVPVPALTPGTYKATWTVIDPNGDMRILTTRFIEEPALQGPPGPPGPRGPQGPPGKVPKFKVTCKLQKHHKITCTVKFLTGKGTKGTLRISVARGKHLVALGHARIIHGRASMTMRELRRVSAGSATITIVLSQPHKAAATRTTVVHVKQK
ncbi:MAG: hypothetical protein JO304_10890 [Solirubrobacterales bacterium]|nr:hypothetical protein [Solirubrobacterales bacterium]